MKLENLKAKLKDYLTKLQGLSDKQKKIVLWTIVVILGLIMGFFWFNSAAKRFSEIGNVVGNIEFPQIGTIDTLTTDWQTYKNEEYGFEIKYPSESNFSREGQCIMISLNGGKIYIGLPLLDIPCGGITGFALDTEELGKETINVGGRTYQADGRRVGSLAFFSFTTESGLFITYEVNNAEDLNSDEYKNAKKLDYKILSTFKFTK